MASNLSPRELQLDVYRGFRRSYNFRMARMMFLKAYIGQYYDSSSGSKGQEPMNLVYHAMRALLPQIVMSNPTYTMKSEFAEYADYGELMALGLNFNAKQLKLKDIFRLWMVDSILGGIGTLKTGLASTGSVITFDDETGIDPGQLYTDFVEFDNFVFDPNLRGPIQKAQWMGDKSRVKRSYLMDTGLYDNAMIEKLPSASESPTAGSEASRASIQTGRQKWNDEVEIVEIWIPGANEIVTVSAPVGGSGHASNGPVAEKFLREDDAFCPHDGPYTFLTLTPPVPGNPMAIAPVGIWYDLHVMTNRMVSKTVAQAERQKDIVVYRRSAADDAQEALDAGDGQAIGIDDPDGIQTISFGGQKNENLQMTGYLQSWFNMMAANPQGIGGQALDADSATEAQILQANADVGINDMRNLVYEAAAEEGRKRAWFLHTDPLLDMTLGRRRMEMTENGPQPVTTSVRLTPEVRRGDFLDWHFTVEPESMSRMDTQTRIQRAMEFVGKQLPAIVTTGQMMQQMGLPFNLPETITRLAKEAGMDWWDEVWYDPMFQNRIAFMIAQSPAMQKGTAGASKVGLGTPAKTVDPLKALNQGFQQGANVGQAGLDINESKQYGV